LIKAASFKALPVRHADTFIEALYAKNVAFPEDRFEHSELLAAIEQASPEQIDTIGRSSLQVPATLQGSTRRCNRSRDWAVQLSRWFRSAPDCRAVRGGFL